MLDQLPQTLSIFDESESTERTYWLVELEVYNWGPFRGFHRAEFDPFGTAIIGPTGSGKTTLIDALMTLLVAQPRYNLASTGGHESDRTLVSYVRGVLGGEGTDGCEEVVRPGRTTTGICARYEGGSEVLRLGAVLWTEGTSNNADDLKRRWIFSQAENQTLEDWLRLLHDDGVRELIRSGRETAKLRVFDSKKAYLIHVRKFFDVGENAFTLLNRAAGLKQLNSIDEIFRDLVLDDRSAFTRALEVASEFDTLVGIHNELETARRQLESLLPVAEEHQRLLTAQEALDRWTTLKRIVPIWFAIAGMEKWKEELSLISREKDRLESEILGWKEQEKDCRLLAETLQERYLNLGGNVIGELEKAIDAQEKLVTERQSHVTDYRRMVSAFDLGEELNEKDLKRNQTILSQMREGIQKQRSDQWEEVLAACSLQQQFEKKHDEIDAALTKVRERPGSNIPPHFQDFRAELAGQLSLPEGDLPFLAELLEVKSEQSAWRGAIERAIGSDRLRILVPADNLDAALRWVNDRNNRLHVRLQRAQRNEQPVTFFQDSYAHKVNFKSHSLQGAAKRLLSNRDLHCVSSAAALKTVEHGLTLQGMISGRQGKFEKQDQHPLHEGWMTGFNNTDRLDALVMELKSTKQSVIQSKAEAEKRTRVLNQLDSQLTMIDALVKVQFSKIDLPGAESDLANSRFRLQELLDPRSDASQAKTAFDAENLKLKSISESIRNLEGDAVRLEARSGHASREHDKAHDRIGDGLIDTELILAQECLCISPDIKPSDLADAERTAGRNIDKELNEQQKRLADVEQHLVRFMGVAKNIDQGALADIGSDIVDVSHYLDRLRVLKEEALPEKRTRFLEYLNRSSDQGVTQLLAGIDEEVDAIEQRIKELNHTLVKVDFRQGRYLQLQPQRITHERLRSLEAAMRKVRSAALKDDEGESHFKALHELVELLRDAGGNPRQLGARALLDPRYRLQFYVVEVERLTGNQSARRTGSQSGSGGEKELMASHILTASLSYALCPDGASRPLYGTIILDEAFSKSSPSAASRIIEALRIFCLHPIFVTPNKEIGLLKQHTRKVICVQRPAKEASLASISWEKLEELARKQ